MPNWRRKAARNRRAGRKQRTQRKQDAAAIRRTFDSHSGASQYHGCAGASPVPVRRRDSQGSEPLDIRRRSHNPAHPTSGSYTPAHDAPPKCDRWRTRREGRNRMEIRHIAPKPRPELRGTAYAESLCDNPRNRRRGAPVVTLYRPGECGPHLSKGEGSE
jgi:hypothetical protein